MTTVLLIRHGETSWNRTRRLQGWAPIPLTDRGRNEARELGVALARQYNVDSITASDLCRAAETAELIAESVARPVILDVAWRERDFGVLQGLSYDTFDERHPEYSLSRAGETAVAARPERGESLADLGKRVRGAWDRLVASAGANETHLVVSHGGPIYLVLGQLQGRSIAESVLEFSQANCAVNEIRIEDGTPDVVRENDTTWRPSPCRS